MAQNAEYAANVAAASVLPAANQGHFQAGVLEYVW
jgi:hypothetical protein